MEHFISKILILKIDTFLWIYFIGLISVTHSQFKIRETISFLKRCWSEISIIRDLSFKHQLTKTNTIYTNTFLSSRKSLEEKYPKCLELLKKYTILKFTNTESAKNLDNPENLTNFMNAIRLYKDASEYAMLINFDENETRDIIQETHNKIDFSKNVSIGYLKREFKETFARYLPIFIYKNLVESIILVFNIAFKMKPNEENKFFKIFMVATNIIGFTSGILTWYVFLKDTI